MKMRLKTKLMLAGAFVTFISLLAGAWPLALLGLLVGGWMVVNRYRSASDGTQGAARRRRRKA